MQSKVTEIAPDVFRISTFHPEYGIQFNQFLIRDDEPFIMHTGFKKMFPITLEGMSSVIDPSRLRWIGFSRLPNQTSWDVQGQQSSRAFRVRWRKTCPTHPTRTALCAGSLSWSRGRLR